MVQPRWNIGLGEKNWPKTDALTPRIFENSWVRTGTEVKPMRNLQMKLVFPMIMAISELGRLGCSNGHPKDERLVVLEP